MDQNISQRVMVAIPCYNEEMTIACVIGDFRRELPQAEILVVDNNSTDKTSTVARENGARVICEKKQGKGFAVQRIFDECDKDFLVLVDGDDTYNAKDIHPLLNVVAEDEAEMAVGNRIHQRNYTNFATSHWWGNQFLTMTFNMLFRTRISDMESGLRVIHRRFVDSSALLAGGFGIEPELNIQATEKGFRIKEFPISIKPRRAGSQSKLNTIRDGTIVLYTILSLFRDYKPLQFFSLIALGLLLAGTGLGIYSIQGYFSTGIVRHIPALTVSGFLFISSFSSFLAGLILSSIKRRHDELIVLIRRKNK